MHRIVQAELRRIVATTQPRGRILEIGAMPRDDTLLALAELQDEACVGINLRPATRYRNFEIIEGNANDMPMFGDASFDCVLCNAMLEHDPYFWRTCAEIRRVVRPGGLAIIGVPSFVEHDGAVLRAVRRLAGRFFTGGAFEPAQATLTFRHHGAPADYYRFSETACREILLEGFRDVRLRSLMTPPRTIAYGYRIGAAPPDA